MIIDLRDYTTTPGCRDLLIERCENQIFDEQVRLGATILGIFRDALNEDRYIWLRGMPDMDTRKQVLTAFYTNGEMWKSQKKEVNSWIKDSDDVLLLNAITEFAKPAQKKSVVGMYSYLKKKPFDGVEIQAEVNDAILAAEGRLLVAFATSDFENNYPRHPIRSGEYGFVWFATYPEDADHSLNLKSVLERRLLPSKRSKMR